MNNDDDDQCRNVFLCIQKTQKKSCDSAGSCKIAFERGENLLDMHFAF